MASSSSFVSQEEFNLFHSIDRDLYSILAIELWRDPVESMQIMALWLWLERMGFGYIIKKMLSLPCILINELADEAIICLTCITSDHFASSFEIPLIQGLVEKEISLGFFHDNRLSATQGVAKAMNEVCMRAFSDIMKQVIQRNANQTIIDSQSQTMSPAFQQSSAQPSPPQTVIAPQNVLQPWTQENGVPTDDRTMFVTFSKGYPVHEWEVREFLTKTYGNCVESLHMQDVERNEQSLYARIVFHSPTTITVILNGADKAKFSINGKHVWARKFVPKRTRTPLPSLSPPNLQSSFGL